MGKPDTFDRIEKSYRRGKAFIFGWRVLCVAVMALYLYVVFGDGNPQWWEFLYLLLPPLWWALSVGWSGSNEYIRELRLKTLRIRNNLDSYYGSR